MKEWAGVIRFVYLLIPTINSCKIVVSNLNTNDTTMKKKRNRKKGMKNNILFLVAILVSSVQTKVVAAVMVPTPMFAVNNISDISNNNDGAFASSFISTGQQLPSLVGIILVFIILACNCLCTRRRRKRQQIQTMVTTTKMLVSSTTATATAIELVMVQFAPI